MNCKKILFFVLIVIATNLHYLGDAVAATSISTSCLYQTNGIPRSIIVVKGKGLRGKFYARVYSPAEERWVTSVKPKLAKRGTVKFIFDSDPAAIEGGASEISANFNQNEEVGGSIRNAETNARIAAVGADCIIR